MHNSMWARPRPDTDQNPGHGEEVESPQSAVVPRRSSMW